MMVAYQLCGLVSAFTLQAVFFLVARLISPPYWIAAYFTLILSVCSCLSWRALVEASYQTPLLLGILSALAVFQLFRERTYPKWPTDAVSLLAIVIIGIDLLYGAFPFYRPDQWSYHLWVAKLITTYGKLPGTILNDHMYFSGIYEYLFLIPRFFNFDDISVQSFADSFTQQTIFVGIFGVFNLANTKLQLHLRKLPLLAASLVLALPMHMHLVNAKPDALLIPLGLLCLVLAEIVRRKIDEKAPVFFLTFLLASAAAFKLTWLHFALALTFWWLIFQRKSLGLARMKAAAWGIVGGIVICLPYLVKNYVFFANPIHPIQTSLFPSKRWLPEMHTYWLEVTEQAVDLYDYGFKLATKVWYLPWAFKFLTLTLILMVAASYLNNRNDYSRERETWRNLAIIVAAYVLLWPKFFATLIYPRFYYTFASILMFAIMLLSSRLSSKRVLTIILVTSLVLNGGFEVKIKKLLRHFRQTPSEFYSQVLSHAQEFHFSQVINEHKRKYFGEPKIDQALVLSSTNSNYFLDTPELHLFSHDFTWVWRKNVQRSSNPCMWRFLSDTNIRYFLMAGPKKRAWPKKFTRLLPFLEIIEKDSLYFIPQAVIDQQLLNC